MIEFKEAKILEKAKEKEEAKRAKKLEEEKIYEERIQKLERFRGLALTDEKPRRRNSFSSTLESTECFWDWYLRLQIFSLITSVIGGGSTAPFF